MKAQLSLLVGTYLWTSALSAQILSAQTGPLKGSAGQASLEGLSRSYRTAPVPNERFQNSDRLRALTRDGKLYLSLQDAIALALENNLDIDLERYGPRIADSDLMRARAGSLLRGVPLTVLEGPNGVGGPVETPPGSSPPLTPSSSAIINAGSNPAQDDLSITGATPLSTGPPVPLRDPVLTGTISPGYSDTPQASQFLTGSNSLIGHTLTGNFGFVEGLSTGGALSAGYTNLRQSLNNGRLDFNPYVASSLGLTFTQPLLQGFGFGLNGRYIRIARNDERMSDLVFRQQVISTVWNVINLYWDLVSLNEDVRVKREASDLAQKLLEDNKARVEVGTLAPLEVTRAEAEVAQARQNLTNAESLVLEQELVLKDVLTRTGTEDAKVSAARIVPTDRIEVPEQEQLPPLEELVHLALQERPDLEAGQVQIENTRIALKGSRNALLPSLNFFASAQGSALAGQVNTLPLPGASPGTSPARSVDPSFLGGYGTTLSQIFRGKFPDYSVGLELNVPLRNRTARADLAHDRLILRQSEVRLRQLQNRIREQVEAAWIAVKQARVSYQAARQTRILEERALEDERQQFEVGVATSYDVILSQRDLAQARSNEVVTAGDYIKARTALDRATGTTLRNNNVILDEAYNGQVTRPPGALPADEK